MQHSGTVALFYDGFEAQANDGPLGKLRSDTRGMARQIYRGLRRRQPYTGFYTAFLNVKESLEHVGLRVRVNDFAFARKNPDMPIGIAGYGSIYEKIDLPNPALFGPGHVPGPQGVLAAAEKCNIALFTHPSEWCCQILRPVLGDKIQPMFAGINTDLWPDLSGCTKTNDVLIYDKIRWNRDERVPELLKSLKRHLTNTGRNFTVLRYGAHHLKEYRAALKKSRSMVFLCEHETQGLAYQEALSSGVPVLAWDEGHLVDEQSRRIAPTDLKVSSVPYFDARCGATFQAPDMIPAFEAFWEALPSYHPRAYVLEALSREASAKQYLSLLEGIGPLHR